jgi:hypothetical protein
MAKQIQIEIPKPCHENWDTMSPEQKGKFCGVCSKTVVDFSLMGDGQILETLRKTTNGVCGRFNADQLERPLVKPLQPKWYMHGMWKYVLSSFMLFKVANIKAQVKPEITNCNNQNRYNNPKLMGKIAMPLTEKNKLVKGTVVNTNGKILEGIMVQIAGTGIGTSTDKKGNFIINVRKNQQLEIFALGYKTLVVTPKTNVANRIVLHEDLDNDRLIMGIMDFGPIENFPENSEQELRYTIKDSLTREPIPFATATLNLDGKQTIQVANDKGEIVFKMTKNKEIADISVSSVGYMPIRNHRFPFNESNKEIMLRRETVSKEPVPIVAMVMGRLKKSNTVCTASVKAEKLEMDKKNPEKTNAWKSLQSSPVTQQDLTVFPNPVNRTENLQLEYVSATEEKILFQLSSENGKIIYLQKETARTGANRYQLKIPANTASQILLLQLMNSRGKWIAAEKLVLQ